MKLTAEQLSLHLAHGDWVAMKTGDLWRVLMYENAQGIFQGTDYCKTIDLCLEELSGLETMSNELSAYSEYKIIKPAPKLMKAGDKCQIIDTPELRKWIEDNNWGDITDSINKKGLTIEYSDGTVYDVDGWSLPHWAVARDFSEEETLSGKEVTVIVDGKEYTAVIK